MRANLFPVILLLHPTFAMADLSNTQICDLAEDNDRLEDITVYQCTCAMDKADKHLDHDMKLALVEAMVAGTSPIHAMLARGYKMNDIANHMEAYGTATGAECGIVHLS